MIATLYHNPACSKSRRALELLREAGAEVRLVDYLRHPPSPATLAGLYARAGLSPRDGLRACEPLAWDLGLIESADDGTILAAMAAHPALIERPLVETDKGVVLARPPERVREIL